MFPYWCDITFMRNSILHSLKKWCASSWSYDDTVQSYSRFKAFKQGWSQRMSHVRKLRLRLFWGNQPVTLKLKYEIKPLSVLISFNQCYIFLFALIAFAIFCQLSRSALRDKCEFGKSVGRHCQYFFLSVRHILQVNWSAGVLMILSHPL